MKRNNSKNVLFLKSRITQLILISLLFSSDICFSWDEEPAFETSDLSGSTINYSGTISTVASNLPSSANKVISEVMYRCPPQTPSTVRCLISFDGTTYFTLWPGEFIAWSAKGRIKQIKIKSNAASVSYEALINYEAY